MCNSFLAIEFLLTFSWDARFSHDENHCIRIRIFVFIFRDMYLIIFPRLLLKGMFHKAGKVERRSKDKKKKKKLKEDGDESSRKEEEKSKKSRDERKDDKKDDNTVDDKDQDADNEKEENKVH
jgi:hypothetical protein